MSDDQVTIEVDGKPLSARKGAMLIEATDKAGVYIPRFCYHEKLSVAANCRMCLVEVEKAPKPLPACATPVMEGMKVFTRSDAALKAQKATMEFLLINHPLDCPICDQGGECELQDLAMGYGSDVSRYTERKRVVADKNIGPLIQTDMTRCIHCTRCVRFGEEIAGLQELGVTGRGENMEIGTYIEKTVSSEMSGNVIDLCPVGALTSKPYRYSARAWELRESDGVAPHDCMGSNIHLHTKGQQVKRVVPRENASINEVWISDRDRYSYEGLYAEDRLTTPMIKKDGAWREVDWETALEFAAAGIQGAVQRHGAEQIGALTGPSSTVEEYYLLQKLLRALGSSNVDHRLRQGDFSDQDDAPLFPWLGQSVAELEDVDAALLIGSYVRTEQPIANHRLRKAALAGAKIMAVNPRGVDFNYDLAQSIVASPTQMVAALAGIAEAFIRHHKASADAKLVNLLTGADVNPAQRAIAEALGSATRATVLLGKQAFDHPAFSQLRTLAGIIAQLSGARLGYLPEGANSGGAWLAGAVPHRGPAGSGAKPAGLHAGDMLERALKAYVLLGIEPEHDCRNGPAATATLRKADFVVSVTGYCTDQMQDYADCLLPAALFAETSGTYVNAAGDWQSFAAAVVPVGEARPAWKILRVLGNRLGVDGFDYASSEQVRDEVHGLQGGALPDNAGKWSAPTSLPMRKADGLELIRESSMYAIDPLVRRATALQTAGKLDVGGAIHINQRVAEQLRLNTGEQAEIQIADEQMVLPIVIDPQCPHGTVVVRGVAVALDYCPEAAVVKLRRVGRSQA